MSIDRLKQHWRHAMRYPVASARSPATLTAVLLAMVLAGSALEYARWQSHVPAGGLGLADASGSLPNPLLYFGQGSPGARGFRALRQTKNRAPPIGRKMVKAHEQVLANMRYAPAGSDALDFIDDVISTSPPSLQITPATITDNITPTPRSRFPTFPIYEGAPSPPPVPEPVTWSMLVLGMFLMGAEARSRQRRHAEGKIRCDAPCDGPDFRAGAWSAF